MQRRGLRWLRSLRVRLLLVFLLLAVVTGIVFVTGARSAFTVGVLDVGRPLLMDYVDRLADDIIGDGSAPPSIERAQAIAQRLPLVVHISGPQINWQSHPDWAPPAQPPGGWEQERRLRRAERADHANRAENPQRTPDLRQSRESRESRDNPETRETRESRESRNRCRAEDRQERHGDFRPPQWTRLSARKTADGHLIAFDILRPPFERRVQGLGLALLALALAVALAWWFVRWQLRPLHAIGAGAQRFGAGDFTQPIGAHAAGSTHEFGTLAATIDTMGQDIRAMLDNKRALLLAISHELRSPLTRARLHAELLPETPPAAAQREHLLRDLGEMTRLIGDLLESERLAQPHAVLQREKLDLVPLARQAIDEARSRAGGAAPTIALHAPETLPIEADPARLRMLLRNLLDNALRHGVRTADQPGDQPGNQPAVQLQLATLDDGKVRIRVRDWGPGVPAAQLPELAQAFYRPDTARTRNAGGVGLGLYLCRLIAQSHGGQLHITLAHPGLQVEALLPGGG